MEIICFVSPKQRIISLPKTTWQKQMSYSSVDQRQPQIRSTDKKGNFSQKLFTFF